MTKRLEAAVHGFHKAMEDPITEPSDWVPEVRLALAASDAVMFSDEAVERAAKTIHDKGTFSFSRTWEERGEELKELYREDVRTIIAALKEDQ